MHRYFLERESEVFRGMFLSPPPQEGAEGQTDSNPISLPGVTKFEFESLLKFLCKGCVTGKGHSHCHSSDDPWFLSACMTTFVFRATAGLLSCPSPPGMIWIKFVKGLSGS